ncbi:MAG TPA: glucosamine-6-phosphate isomerase [Phycisphaerae bacterium]|nr:glucosamine-6-phosphate isomerase [Phycisphaerae bacterium]
MARPLSKIAPDWWDYTTLDPELMKEVARLKVTDFPKLARDGFRVVMYDDIREFFLAEALEYVNAWRQATPDNPAGICGPIGPTEQLPLVAQIVNALDLNLKDAHFWGMDEWYENGKEVGEDHPLSFARADKELCFNRIKPGLRMDEKNLHFPKADPKEYIKSWEGVRCVVMQGGQGEIKHWAFNDPPQREGKYKDAPPTSAEYRKLTTRVVDLHPLTLVQNARTSGGGYIPGVPSKAISVGPVETWKAGKVSIWHPGWHDNAFGVRLTTYMISKGIADPCVPMSLLAEHPNVQFNYFAPGIPSCDAEMH